MISFEALERKEEKIAVIGLGYVGLPLAVALSRHFDVTGYDLKEDRVRELSEGKDRTLEVDEQTLREAPVRFTHEAEAISECGVVIVAVPTPIDEYRIPDLGPLKSASRTVGRHLRKGAVVVYESTVYPGATEEVCIPILEEASGLRFGEDFSAGYSPERINPGDKVHTLESIVKVVSGSDAPTLELLAALYGKVVTAGIHQASSIKVAEAAKVIENTQRDLNIALMNELSMIFDRVGIDTLDVLAAAGTKWNFLPFRPGLVGGHCSGVDPYYLTFKAEALGYHPEMILAGRRINDTMGKYIAERTVKLLIGGNKQVKGARVAVLGLTFKEDVPDLRNTRVVDIIAELSDYGVDVVVHDPMADAEEARRYYGISLSPLEDLAGVDAVVMAVGHGAYRTLGLKGLADRCGGGQTIFVDVKGLMDPSEARQLGFVYWRL
jgi:UDP-N-acetyl-D-galactosamine dehydrogenase